MTLYVIIGLILIAISVINMMICSYVDGLSGRQEALARMDYTRLVVGVIYIVPTLASFAYAKGKTRRFVVNK